MVSKCKLFISFSCILLFNIALVIIGTLTFINQIDNSSYSVLKQEINSWSLGAITDVRFTNESNCHQDEEQLSLKFYGTQDQCYNSMTKASRYSIKQCTYPEVFFGGIDPQPLNKLNKNITCLKRSSTSTYHDIASRRNIQECKNSTFCGGSTSNADKRYCLIEKQCFTNDLKFNYNATKKVWSKTALSNNTSNNPFVDMYIGLSRPCVNLEQNYMSREVEIPQVYSNKVDECQAIQGVQADKEYLESGYKQDEGSVYQDNSILSLISSVQNYSSSDLLRNQFKLYYKPYPFWSYACQQSYSTRQVSEVFKKEQTFYKSQLEISSITYACVGAELIMVIVYIIRSLTGKKSQCTCYRILKIMCIALVFIYHLVLLALYVILYLQVEAQDLKLLSFASGNLCSNDFLNNLFQTYYSSIENLRIKSIIGSVVMICAIVMKVLLLVTFNKRFMHCYKYVLGCYCYRDDKIEEEQKQKQSKKSKNNNANYTKASRANQYKENDTVGVDIYPVGANYDGDNNCDCDCSKCSNCDCNCDCPDCSDFCHSLGNFCSSFCEICNGDCCHCSD